MTQGSRRRVLVLSTEPFRFQSTNPLDLAEGLASDGCDVTVAAPFATEALESNRHRGFSIHRLEPGGNASFWWRSLRTARALRPDVVVGVNSVGFVAADLVRLAGLARACVAYQLELPSIAESPRSVSVRWFAGRVRHAELVLSTSEARAEVLRDRFHTPETPLAIANAPVRTPERASPELLQAARDKGLRGSRVLVYAGAHGSMTCLAAAAEASRLWASDVGLAIVAFGGSEAERRVVAEAVGRSEGRAVELAPVSGGRDKLLGLLAAFDAGLVLYDHRGDNGDNVRLATPNKLYDYLAAGLPVVASDTPGVLASADEAEFGVCCDPRDPRAIANAVDRLFADRERHAERTRSVFAERFSYARQSEAARKRIMALAAGAPR